MRAFSMIEVMVTVAILGIISALAIPNLLPEVHKAQLNANTEAAANFLSRARTEAMTSKRCVVVTRNAATGELFADRLNSFDCDTTTTAAPTAPFIDTGSGALIRFARLKPSTTSVTFAFDQFPAELATFQQVRIRPSGRVFGKNVSQTDDDAVLRVTHADLVTGNTRKILYEGHGLICALNRGIDPQGTAPNFSCPGA